MWRFSYIVTEQDYIDFNEHFLFNIPAGKKSLRTYRLIFPIALVISVLVMIINDSNVIAMAVSLIISLIFSLLWWFNAHRLILFIVKRQLRKKDSLERSLFSPKGETIFDFENRIIVDMGDKEEVRVRFDNITNIFETHNAYYFYYSPAKALILPYSAFKGPEEFFSFQQLVRSSFAPGYPGR